MIGSGGSGSWSMITIAAGASNIVIRDLYLNGNKAGVTSPDEHTHTLQVGGTLAGGTVKGVYVYNCVMDSPFGDGVALAPLSGAYGTGQDLTDVTIEKNTFLNCGRSGVSNQRGCQLVRIINNYFEGTSDQDIDFEPTNTPGPRRYVIMGNYMIRSNTTVGVTLSGCSGADPSEQNIFAFNHIVNGTVGGFNVDLLEFFGNFITIGSGNTDPVVRFHGTVTNLRIADNYICRPVGSSNGLILDVESDIGGSAITGINTTTDVLTIVNHGLTTGDGPIQVASTGTIPAGLTALTNYWIIWPGTSSNELKLATSFANAIAGTAVDITDSGSGTITITQLVKYPNRVDVHYNRFVTYVGLDGNATAILFRNTVNSTFKDNSIINYSGTTLTTAVVFDTTATINGTTAVTDWVLSNNRVVGNADQSAAGLFTYGLTTSPVGTSVTGIVLNENTFRGCTNKIRFAISGSGGSAYGDIPIVIGNGGSGTDFAEFSNVGKVLIGGNFASQGIYLINSGAPTFSAAKSSLCLRKDGVAGGYAYINTDGSTTWAPLTDIDGGGA